MTESEAIKELERHIQFLRENWKPHPDYNVIEALGTAIKALEKQIAKKPVPNKPIINDSWSEDSFLCPICNNWVSMLGGYCGCCGQRIAPYQKGE